MHANRKAFLDLIAYAEGTADKGFNGYNVIVGGELFTSYADHPRKVVALKVKARGGKPARTIYSSAAGRYQLLQRYWDAYRVQLKLKTFEPESQDLIALQQIRECGALADIDAGRIEEAVQKCRRIWASFPGAGYGQREHKLAPLLQAYRKAGGWLD